MQYWIYLAWRYMVQHKSRTLYSIFGISISFVLCFVVLTTGYSVWDYGYQLSGGKDIQMEAEVSNWNEENEEQGFTEEMVAQVRTLEQCDEVKQLRVYDETWLYPQLSSPEEADQDVQDHSVEDDLCTTDELKPGHMYRVGIQLKDLSDLQDSAASLQEQCGLEIKIDPDVEKYLGQGDSLFKSFYYAAEAILASVVAFFSIIILRNTLNIAVVERMKDYGIYRCVGMSKKQLYQVLAVECLLMSLAAVVFGVGMGYGLLQAITSWLQRSLNLEVSFRFGLYYKAVLYTTVLCVAVTLYALLEPSRQASRLSPVEAIHNNIVLLGRKGEYRNSRFHQGSEILGRLFGVSGEYAYKNMQRNRGRFGGVFVSLLLCMTIMGVMESAGESLYATFDHAYQGKEKKYLEEICPAVKYDENVSGQIQKDISEIGQVQDTDVAMYQYNSVYELDPVSAEYLRKANESGLQNYAYNRKNIEYLRQYLIDGSIDYDAMTQEHGVLLCDMKYNVQSVETDFYQQDIRLTDYRVGDRLKCLNQKGVQTVRQIYYDALEQIAEKNGISKQEIKEEGDSPYPDLEYCHEGEPGFQQYKEEFLGILQKQGISLNPQETESVDGMGRFWYLLEQWFCGQDNRTEYLTEYVIQGIISENPVCCGAFISGCNIELIHTADMVKQVAEIDNGSRLIHDSVWQWCVLVSRDPTLIQDGMLERYCENQTKYPLYYGNIAILGDGYDDNNMWDYMNMLHTLRTVKVISILLIACIWIICMIQVYNTLCANLALRRKELRLYELVGMGPKQMRKMLLLEHVAIVAYAVIIGYLFAWAASWFFVGYLLNVNKDIQYVWSGWMVAGMGAGIMVLACLLCLTRIHHVYKH